MNHGANVSQASRVIRPSLNRRAFLQSTAVAGAVLLSGTTSSRGEVDIPGRQPLLDLKQQFPDPVVIEAVDQLQVGDSIWFRVRSADGAEGFCPGNDRLKVTVEMARQLINPYFVQKDAREIESLVDGVYTERDQRGSVYKFAGMPFWNVVGHLEVAVFDLLGRLADRSVSQILANAFPQHQPRGRIPVYISQFGRNTSAEQEVENAARDLQKTGAKATKLKIGLRMNNSKQQTKRDQRMIELARKTFGDDVTIYVDANSSYTAKEAVLMGKFLDSFGVELLEEPLPWQDYEGTRQVTEALFHLVLQVAGGEQDSSLWQWQDMVNRRIVDVLQPDVFYNGGLVRSLRVARMAQQAGRTITPHSPKVLPDAAANLHFCSVLPNLGPFQEYRSYGTVTDGFIDVPTGPGLGIEVDPGKLRTARRL
ncbi:MAG: galactonate dehydratase [Fuerstiella sp.]